MFLIYLPCITSRCEYIFDLIFKDELGITYQLTADVKIFDIHKEEKLNYSFDQNSNELYVQATPLLFEKEIRKIDVPVTEKLGTTVLFESDNSCDLGFDIFSAVFYMVSRYEEYLPFTPDKYGRYKASDCIAYNSNFLQKPVVNIWINIFRKVLNKRFPDLQLKTSSFSYIATYDIDIAYAFKGRSLLRNIGAIIKHAFQLKFKNIFNRIRTLINLQNDPWDVYNLLCNEIKENKVHSIFFFLLADYSKYNKNISYKHRLMHKLIAKVSSCSDIGIHPSFESSIITKKISLEKQRLENICRKQINKSRQHFLKFTLPETYNHLINAGITEDYSMGFAALPGFRAGTCNPFYFYDLKESKTTSLKIYPTTLMEVTFIDYLRLPPNEALEYIVKLIEEVKKVDGTFISIWHNDTLCETNVWRQVHDKMIKQVSLHV